MSKQVNDSHIPQFTYLSTYLGYKLDRQAAQSYRSVREEDSRTSRRRLLRGVGMVVLALLGIMLVLLGMRRTLKPISTALESVHQDVEKLVAARSEELVISSAGPQQHLVVAEETREKLTFAITISSTKESVPDGTVVRFEAVGGEVDPVAATREGLASTTFHPTKIEGEAVIVVSTGNVEQAFTIPLVPLPKLSRIYIEPERTRLLVNGQEKSNITLLTVDEDDNRMAGVPVALRVEPQGAGSLSENNLQTDENGEAAVTFTAGTQPTSLTIIAEAQEDPGIKSTLKLELIPNVAQLRVTPSMTEVWNTGTEEAVLNITLQDGIDRPLADTEVEIMIMEGEAWFLGSNAQPITNTDTVKRVTEENGHAQAQCRFGKAPGQVTIEVQAKEQKQTVNIAVKELKPTEIEIQPDRQELLIGTDQDLSAAMLTITVLDQRRKEVPGVEVALSLYPPASSIAQLTKTSFVTGEADKVVVRALNQTGEVTFKATAGEAVGSTTLRVVKDSDEDGRYDYREDELGTSLIVPDDIVKSAGTLYKMNASTPIIEGIPVGVVLRRANFASQEGYEPVTVLLWVPPDDLELSEGSTLLKPGARIVMAQLPGAPELKATAQAGGYLVRNADGETEMARPDPTWRLVEIKGLFPVEHLNRP